MNLEVVDGILRLDGFLSITVGILVLFVGKQVNDRVRVLREISIPEPVTGGLIFSLLIALLYFVSGTQIEFGLGARDVLLVYFFTTIGINASLKDLAAGGKPLLILLAITISYMFVQNLTGIFVDRRARDSDRLVTENHGGLRNYQCHGDRCRLCHVWTDSRQLDGWPHREIPDRQT